VSFDLAVLAMDEGAGDQDARLMFERCNRSGLHDEGDLDPRIVAFYEQLRSDFPDHPPYDPQSPWMSMPLAVGVDHVIMHLSFGRKSGPAINKIMELATQYRLVLYDPQSEDAHLPAD
jgi:hypothetical protein